MEPQIDALIAWTQIVDAPTPPVVRPSPTKSPDDCAVDITGIVPALVREHQGQNPAFDGPNCWNTSLVLSRIVPALRYTSPEEMHFFMNSPLCRKLAPQEERHPGDVLAIREREEDFQGEEVHGFIYVTDQLVFSKNGFDHESPFALQSMLDVLAEYGLGNTSRHCLSARGTPIFCSSWVNTYRCESMDEFQQSTSERSRPEELQNEKAQLDAVECRIGDAALGTEPWSHSLSRQMTTTLDAMEQTARSKLKALGSPLVPGREARAQGLSREEIQQARFQWNSLLVREGSLREQLLYLP